MMNGYIFSSSSSNLMDGSDDGSNNGSDDPYDPPPVADAYNYAGDSKDFDEGVVKNPRPLFFWNWQELNLYIKKKRIGPVNKGNRTQKPYMHRLIKGNRRRPHTPD